MADLEHAEVVLKKTTLTGEVETPNKSQGKKKKWSNSDIQKLIEEDEARMCLWDTFSADYHNIEETSKAKEELSEVIGVPWKDILTQLTCLRAILGQNMKKKIKRKTGQGTDEFFTPTWIFWDQLQFLVPSMESRQSRDTLKLESTNEDNTMEPVTSQSAPMRKRQVHKTKEELYKECLKVIKGSPANEGESSFGTYVNEKLARFDRRQRAIAEKKITDALFEVEMGAPDGVNTAGLYIPQHSMFHTQGFANSWS